MKHLICLGLICLAAPMVARAQGTAANPAATSAQGTAANPVAASVQEMFNARSKLIIAAVDEMPADKFGYHPTPEQWTFGKIVSHIVGANFYVCSMISDKPMPTDVKVSETDPKDKLAPALQSSFDFCSQAVSSLQDSKLGDTITFFGGRKTVRARAVLEEVADLYDHYSQMAGYLRLNGLLPPSAQPRK